MKIGLCKTPLDEILAHEDVNTVKFASPNLHGEDEEKAKQISNSIISDLGTRSIAIPRNQIYIPVWESIKNASEHGNNVDPNKDVTVHWLIASHPAGTPLLYLVTENESREFNYSTQQPKPDFVQKNELFSWLPGNVDSAYNFGDPAIYLIKVLDPSVEITCSSQKVRQQPISKDSYHLTPMSTTKNQFSKTQNIDAIDLFVLWDLFQEYKRTDRLPSSDALNRDWGSSGVLRPYFMISTDSPKVDMTHCKQGRFQLKYKDGGIPYQIDALSNSLFHNRDTDQIGFSHALSMKFWPHVNELATFYKVLSQNASTTLQQHK